MKPEEIETPESDKAYFNARSKETLECERGAFSESLQSLERRAILAERERDELRKMLSELLIANAAPSITGFQQACERAREFLAGKVPVDNAAKERDELRAVLQGMVKDNLGSHMCDNDGLGCPACEWAEEILKSK